MPPRARVLASSLLLAVLACSPPGGGLQFDPETLSLLRLEYLERAEALPALRFDQVDLPRVERLGAFSPVRWELRVPELPGDEALRALPYADPAPRLHAALARSLHACGFNTQPVAGRPTLRLSVDVEQLVLRSETAPVARRRCELDCVVRIAEAATDLELRRYRARGASELPGAWLALREGHAQWAPRPEEDDPLALAATAAALDFLDQSLDFWREPANWEEGGVSLTQAEHDARPRPPAVR